MDYNKNMSKILPEDNLCGIEIYRGVRFFFVYTHETGLYTPFVTPHMAQYFKSLSRVQWIESCYLGH